MKQYKLEVADSLWMSVPSFHVYMSGSVWTFGSLSLHCQLSFSLVLLVGKRQHQSRFLSHLSVLSFPPPSSAPPSTSLFLACVICENGGSGGLQGLSCSGSRRPASRCSVWAAQ